MRRAVAFSPASPRRPSRHFLRLLIPYFVFAIALSGLIINTSPPVEAVETSFAATKSAYVQFTTPDSNFGGVAHDIFVDCCDAGAVGKSRGLLEFDVTSVVGDTLVEAELRLNLVGFGTTTTRTHCSTQISGAWGELTVTWNNQPGLTALPAICISIPRTAGFYSWDVTPQVTGWLDGTVANNGLKVIDATEDVGDAGAVRQYRGRGGVPVSARPALIVTTADQVEFDVFIDGQLTLISVERNTSRDFKTIVQNQGNAVISEVNLTLLNESVATVTTGIVQNIAIDDQGSDVLRAPAASIPVVLGDFNWSINATFTNGTATTTDDVSSVFNFTLRVVAEGAIIVNFRVVSASLFDEQINLGAFTTLRVELLNLGSDSLFVLIFFNIGQTGGTSTTTPGVLISPSQLTPDALTPQTTFIFDFTVFAQRTGLFPITVRVLPTDATGASIGQIVDAVVVLLISDTPAVTTLSANDIGPTDAILNGKIDSLGGLSSAKVFFIIFKTDVGEASAIIIPTHKEVVTFVSGYRQPTLNILDPSTNYTYEFRLEFPGGEVVGGLINFQTPASFTDPLTGIRNSLAIALNLDSITMGIILGLMVLFFAIFIGTIVTDTPIILAILGMGVAVFNWSIDWWPLWTLVVFIVLIGILLFRLPQFGLEPA